MNVGALCFTNARLAERENPCIGRYRTRTRKLECASFAAGGVLYYVPVYSLLGILFRATCDVASSDGRPDIFYVQRRFHGPD